MIKILFLADIVGEPGRFAACRTAQYYLDHGKADFVIANGENVAGGNGITEKLAIELFRHGISVITSGDHIWDKKDIISFLDLEPRLLRPLNYPANTPGNGSILLNTKHGLIAVISLQGRTYMKQQLENPFLVIMKEVQRLREKTKIIILDFHAEATSEKIAMGYYLDGLVSLVVGTHTHVQTADETILIGGTAFISDAGMCGAKKSILGRECDIILQQFLTSMPVRMPIATGETVASGVLIEVDEQGKTNSIQRIKEQYADVKNLS